MSETDSKPDPYTNAWFRQQMKGVTHTQNRLSALCDDAITETERQKERLEEVEREWAIQHEAMAAEMGRMKETIQQARDAYTKLTQGNIERA